MRLAREPHKLLCTLHAQQGRARSERDAIRETHPLPAMTMRPTSFSGCARHFAPMMVNTASAWACKRFAVRSKRERVSRMTAMGGREEGAEATHGESRR